MQRYPAPKRVETQYMSTRLPCFKVYDVRGVVPSELNAEIAHAIGRALADETGSKTCVIGHDIRLSSEDISRGLAKGLQSAGVEVIDQQRVISVTLGAQRDLTPCGSLERERHALPRRRPHTKVDTAFR